MEQFARASATPRLQSECQSPSETVFALPCHAFVSLGTTPTDMVQSSGCPGAARVAFVDRLPLYLLRQSNRKISYFRKSLLGPHNALLKQSYAAELTPPPSPSSALCLCQCHAHRRPSSCRLSHILCARSIIRWNEAHPVAPRAALLTELPSACMRLLHPFPSSAPSCGT